MSGYLELKEYLRSLGWKDQHRVITEQDTQFIILYSYSRYRSGLLIDLRCPECNRITIAGTNQVSNHVDAYPLKIKLREKNNTNLDMYPIALVYHGLTGVYLIKRKLYKDLSIEDYNHQYRFNKGFDMVGGSLLEIYIRENSDNSLDNIIIDENDIKFELPVDIWKK